ncbi:MAG: helix-turn-helix domain-containing protein [Anaerolineae bacterium]|nr:helix-turn-helix domain-containing protein [Anaerolineae bacterium]
MLSDVNDRPRLLNATIYLIELLLGDSDQEFSTMTVSNSGSLQNGNLMEAENMETNQSGELLTPAQAAVLVGTVTARTISDWARRGLIPAKKIGGRWYVIKAGLLEMLKFYDSNR